MTKIEPVADAGEIVVLPAWSASTPQVPKAKSLSEFPFAEQMDGVVVLNVTSNPLDAVALKVATLAERSMEVGVVNAML